MDEARHIIDTQQPPASRPADGHDILGTYRCVADAVGRKAVSEEPQSLVGYLRDRHQMILEGRPEMEPGRWKQKPNQVGTYLFVDPKLVEGTLHQGFELAQSVSAGFRRAMFVMAMVTEIHPFADGNGRVARVMMNAELSAVDAARIVIPSVYRSEYIASLRSMSASEGHDVSALMRVMGFAWRWTAAMPWEDRAATEGQMEATNALRDPDDAAIGGIKLILP
ncbi:MAG: Fic family protein [bacterium]|nr:Fic family protein [bacterium]